MSSKATRGARIVRAAWTFPAFGVLAGTLALAPGCQDAQHETKAAPAAAERALE